MKWQKIGRIFNPEILRDRGLNSALMPTAEILDVNAGTVRVYFAPRDEQNRSQIHFFDFDIRRPMEPLNISKQPLFTHGKTGTFDDSGVTLGSIVQSGNKKLLYYTGWSLAVSVPFNNSIGIAEFFNGSFKRCGDGPIMTRTLHEPYSCASPFVMKENGVFRMWYASMDKWQKENNSLKHYYNIKYAESDDGINWKRKNIVAIDYQDDEEYAFGRPFILKENGLYKMWYSYRGGYYKIGYAESENGVEWKRKDHEAGIDISVQGWDSEMIEYPYIFDYKGERYMLYNGNGYGKTGIGFAKLIE